MGEATIRGNVSHGDGVYKSTDAGKTWTHLGLEATRNIAKIRVHPTNPDLVFVAALGHAHGANPERGVYRSTNGGKTWDLVLTQGEDAGAIDLVIDPNNPRIIFASFWEGRRGPHYMSSGGPGSGLWRSTDGGDTWTDLSAKPGMPKGIKGKIGIAVSPAQTDRVWALVEHDKGGVFRSDDGGETWERLSEDRNLRQRAWYYSHLTADPQDANTVWCLNVEMWRSVDGGATFHQVPAPHGDNHDLWIDPADPEAHDPRQRRRRHRLLQRRPLLVDPLQPADRRDVPRHHRHPDALPRLRRPARQHHHERPQPLQLRRHHHHRVVRDRRLRVRPHRHPSRQP